MSRRIFALFIALGLVLAACSSAPSSIDLSPDPNAPQAETGLDSDALPQAPQTSGGGYTSKVSVVPGESLDFHISNGATASFTLSIYREGAERRLMGTIPNVRSGNYSCANKYATGCDWPVATTYTIPNDWPTGIYTVDMPRAGGQPLKTLFFVRPARPTARILFLTSINTYQAYNDFGGGSLYGFGDAEKGTQVSFNRPYFYGTGFLNRWEGQFVTWAEKAGYDMDYAATYDLEFVPDLLDGYDVVIIAGHSEYWTHDMRRRMKEFITDGGRFMNLSGNTMWWQVRYEDDGRTLVGYKNWQEDPEKAPELSTDNPGQYPILDSPLSLIGLYWPYGGYPGEGGDGYYAANADHWVFAGTGVVENQLIGDGPGVESSLHDKESDGMPFNCAADGAALLGPPGSAGTPANFTPLGITTVSSHIRGSDSFALMGITTRPGGGALFAAGTTGWAGALWDPTIDRMTRNLLDRFLAGNFPQEPNAPDSDYLFIDRFNCYQLNRNRFTTNIGDAARLNYVFTEKVKAAPLTAACGVDGAGLQLSGTPTGQRFVSGLGPNWSANAEVHMRVYLNLRELKVGKGAVLTLFQQYADNRVDAPLAVAAVRADGARPSPTTTALIRRAITVSDNAAAEQLWSRLGGSVRAASAVGAVLADGGDPVTRVPSRRLRPGYTVFGQTSWPLTRAASYAAQLPCQRGTAPVMTQMGRISAGQRWGLGVLGGSARFKGGWGPDPGGAYLVRQLGVLTLPGGKQVGVAIASRPASGTFRDGTAALTAVTPPTT